MTDTTALSHSDNKVTEAMEEQDAYFMRLAIDEANKSVAVDTAYCVGAILVMPNWLAQSLSVDSCQLEKDKYSMTIVSTGYSRELPGNTHAEECCLLKLSSDIVDKIALASVTTDGSSFITMYTTMEPCVHRLSGKPSCTQRLLATPWIRRIVVGVYEPSTFVQAVDGVEQLRVNNRIVRVLQGWEQACLAPNQHVL
ncbi:cytidine deaminase-like protein [Syncephalis fuscata]|nr:cytidine deaminase-like protein [Syncephalis fuscata]